MTAANIILGRGIVTLGGVDLGLCSSLALRHEVESVSIAVLDSEIIGGAGEIARRTRVFVDLALHELSAANRGLIWDVAGDADPVELIWTGRNKLSASCDTDAHVLTVPSLVVLPAALTQLLPDDLGETAIPVTGEALRAAGTSDWYTFSFVPG